MTAFKPGPKQSKKELKGHVLLELTPEGYAEVKSAARASGISIKEFCRQAVRFALDSM